MGDRKLLTDTDFLIALYKKDDTNHKKSIFLLEEVGRQQWKLIVSIFSYAETVTILSQRISHRVAVNFIEDIDKAGINIIHSDEVVFKKAKDLFRKQLSKNVSFVDVLNMAFCKLSGYSQILSFDIDYKKNNIKRFGID